MKRITVLVAAVIAVGAAAYLATASGQASKRGLVPAYVTIMPAGYRDFRLISVAHEADGLNSLGAILGNDAAIAAYRQGRLPFPEGAVIAALHYRHTPSAANNRIFGKQQSFVPGAPTNIQFMVKNSRRYAATGGWGFGNFTPDGRPSPPAAMRSCYPCHARIQAQDSVFTRYAR